MKTITHNVNENARVWNPSVLIGGGTSGFSFATSNRLLETKQLGTDRLNHTPTLVIDTAESSRGFSLPLGPGRGSVCLEPDEMIILPERTTGELAEMASRYPCMRRDAEELALLPPASSKEGAGGHKIFSANTIKAVDHQIVQALSKLFADARDRCHYGELCDRGTPVVQSDVLDAYFFGSGYASTFAGTVIYLLLRAQYAAKLLGLRLRSHVIMTSPTVAKTHDLTTAWASFGATTMELLLAQTDRAKIKIGLFSGAVITPEPGLKLLDTFTVWGASTGHLVAGDRDEVSASIGMLLYFLSHSHLGSLSESAFCDPQKVVLDKSHGYRGLRRLGLARFAVEESENRELAFNAALQAISRMINPQQN
jgi:hypothetical protein